MKVGDVVVISDTKMLREDIRHKRGRILEINKGGLPHIRIEVIEGKQKGLIIWLPSPSWFEVIKERVVFT